MALKSQSKPERVAIPHEPDQWVEVMPASAGDLRDLNQQELNNYDYNLQLATRMVVGWSYPVALTLENLTDLDTPTFRWLVGVLDSFMNVRPEAEKKDSSSRSTRGRELATAGSPAS